MKKGARALNWVVIRIMNESERAQPRGNTLYISTEVETTAL